MPVINVQRTAGGQAAQRGEHHHEHDVLRPQLALKEEGAESVDSGCVGCFHGSQLCAGEPLNTTQQIGARL